MEKDGKVQKQGKEEADERMKGKKKGGWGGRHDNRSGWRGSRRRTEKE